MLKRVIKKLLRLPLRMLAGGEPVKDDQFVESDSLQQLTDARPQFVPRQALKGEHPVQVSAEGVGALFHRHYAVDIAEPTVGATELMARIQADPNEFTPALLARFEKTNGQPGAMAVGDDYHIHISGPWDGPVRVIDVQPLSFTFVTLEGHLEAGEITFRFDEKTLNDDYYRFEIISWARSRDWIVNFAYDTLGAAKVAQTGMWVVFCQRVAQASGGNQLGNVEVRTEKVNFSDGMMADG